MRILRHPGDLPQAEVLVAAVIVQPDDARQLARRSDRLQHQRFRRRSIRQLPLQMFDRQSVELELVLNHRYRRCRAARSHQRFTESRACDGPPGIDVLKHRLPERRACGGSCIDCAAQSPYAPSMFGCMIDIFT